jgi:hypothetical protein
MMVLVHPGKWGEPHLRYKLRALQIQDFVSGALA